MIGMKETGGKYILSNVSRLNKKERKKENKKEKREKSGVKKKVQRRC